MTEKEYYIICAIEECNELAHILSKALRFGMNEVSPDPNITQTNKERIIEEFNDLTATLEKVFECFASVELLNGVKIQEKIAKMKRMLEYSRECGIVE